VVLDDSDDEWEVEELEAVRGPPENRFWKLRWAPYTDEESDVHAAARASGERDDGSWVHGWQPAANCQRLVNMQIHFWQSNRHLHPLASLEMEGEHRCTVCNEMFHNQRKLATHMRSECPFREKARSRDSPAGRRMQRAVNAAYAAKQPRIVWAWAPGRSRQADARGRPDMKSLFWPRPDDRPKMRLAGALG
jgi:hypothetical protein